MSNIIDAEIKIDLEGVSHDDYLWLIDEIKSNFNHVYGGTKNVDHGITKHYEVTND